MPVSTATEYRCQHCGGLKPIDGPRHVCPDPLAPGSLVRVHHRDGRTEDGTIVGTFGRRGEPLRYEVRFACGCTLPGIDPLRIETVYSAPGNGPSEGSNSAEPAKKRPSRYRASR